MPFISMKKVSLRHPPYLWYQDLRSLSAVVLRDQQRVHKNKPLDWITGFFELGGVHEMP